jgi:hypothetical protein
MQKRHYAFGEINLVAMMQRDVDEPRKLARIDHDELLDNGYHS